MAPSQAISRFLNNYKYLGASGRLIINNKSEVCSQMPGGQFSFDADVGQAALQQKPGHRQIQQLFNKTTFYGSVLQNLCLIFLKVLTAATDTQKIFPLNHFTFNLLVQWSQHSGGGLTTKPRSLGF